MAYIEKASQSEDDEVHLIVDELIEQCDSLVFFKNHIM